jgi:hypothetical protein
MIVLKSFLDYVAFIPLCFFLIPCQCKNHLLSLCVSSFPLHVDASIGYIFFICFLWLCSFASFSMFGLCCAKASSLHYCNFICVFSLQNVIKPILIPLDVSCLVL